MTTEEPAVEAPNWLKELEAKREKRVKAKLGHETGAGAQCLVCTDKCPGLDLHFWRKTCKNCKCSKEDHDVLDDDIHGWAEWQLLGRKPNKINTKITLPGRKEEVELEWAPKGAKETVEKFLQTLPVESIPVKGSQAAQERKQMLQKQIPIHDIDPSLCHDLSPEELQQMNKYIAHIKDKCVGVGQLVSLGSIIRGVLHNLDPHQAKLLSERYGKNIPIFEIVKLQAQMNSAPLKLSKDLENMTIGGNLQNFQANSINPQEETNVNPVYMNAVKDRSYLGYGNIEEAVGGRNYLNPAPGSINKGNINQNQYSDYRPTAPVIEGSTVAQGEQNQDYNNQNQYSDPAYNYRQTETKPGVLESQTAQPIVRNNHNQSTIGDDFQQAKDFRQNKTLPNFASGKYATFNDNQTPKSFGNFKDLAYSTYSDFPPSCEESNRRLPNNNQIMNSGVQEEVLQPHRVPIGAINDIYPEIKTADFGQNKNFIENLPVPNQATDRIINDLVVPNCHHCQEAFNLEEFAVAIDKSDALFHATCFKCAGCSQILADNMYFYHKETDNIYCLRDYAKVKGYPRCKGCDELIFTKEYCLTEENTFHLKHFCCIECDTPLAGQNYLIENSQPICLPCYENSKANKCLGCLQVIKPDEEGLLLKDKHFHVKNECFCCKMCRKPLLGQKLLFRNDKLYCSHDCFQTDE